MKGFIMSAVAAIAAANEYLPFMPEGGTSVQFTQTDPQTFFVMNLGPQTYTVPALPDKGITIMFYLGGTFLSSQYVDHLKFTCKLAGVPVYLQNFPVA